MSKQAANYLLGQLETLGYLERRPDSGDGRSKRIALTDRGERPRTRSAMLSGTSSETGRRSSGKTDSPN